MSDLRDSIAKLCELPDVVPSRDQHSQSVAIGEEQENARLKPVLMALLDCVDALEFYADALKAKNAGAAGLGEPNREAHLMPLPLGTRASEALTALRNLSDKGDGK